jgi:hypothetical protein
MAAFGAIPPWLDDREGLMGAVRAGASLGATLRGQDIAQNEAKDRLSLAYAQLAAENDRADQAANAKLELAHSALDAKAQQNELLNSFRERALQQQEERSQQLGTYRDAMLKQQGEAADLRQQLAKSKMDYYAAGKLIHAGRGIYRYDPKSGSVETLRAPPVELDPLTRFDLQTKAGALRDARRAVSAATASGNDESTKAAHAELDAANKDYLDFRKGIQSQQPLALPKSAPSASPFREGALIRHKDTGKLYRVTNGVPVPEEDATTAAALGTTDGTGASAETTDDTDE